MGPVEKSRPVRIGVLPTDPVRVVGFATIFEGESEFQVVLADLAVLLEDVALNLLLMDIHDMPDVPALLAQVRSRRPDIRTLLIGPPADHNRISALIAGGAKAYLEEFLPAKQILDAIRVVAAGSIWAPRKLLAALIDRLLDRASEPIRDVSEALTEREQQVLLQIMAARSNREIAESLGIEERTVKSYVAKLMKKTGAENRLALSMHSLAQVLLAQKNEDAVRAVTQKPKVPVTKGH